MVPRSFLLNNMKHSIFESYSVLCIVNVLITRASMILRDFYDLPPHPTSNKRRVLDRVLAPSGYLTVTLYTHTLNPDLGKPYCTNRSRTTLFVDLSLHLACIFTTGAYVLTYLIISLFTINHYLDVFISNITAQLVV